MLVPTWPRSPQPHGPSLRLVRASSKVTLIPNLTICSNFTKCIETCCGRASMLIDYEPRQDHRSHGTRQVPASPRLQSKRQRPNLGQLQRTNQSHSLNSPHDVFSEDPGVWSESDGRPWVHETSWSPQIDWLLGDLRTDPFNSYPVEGHRHGADAIDFCTVSSILCETLD